MAASFIERDGGRIAYEVHGAGPLVVLAHGMGNDRQAYRHLVPLLVEAGYRVATVDVRGHGESSVGWPSYAPAEVGADLAAVIRQLGGPATVIGSSSSAGAAIFTAADAPELVTGVVQLSPFAEQPKLNPLMRIALAVVVRSPRLWVTYYRTLFPVGRPDDLDAYSQQLRTGLRERGRMAAVAGVGLPTGVHWTERAGELRCPVLVLMGDRDPDFKDPGAAARAARRRFATAEARMITESGHYPYADQPQRTAVQIVEFLAVTAHA